MLTKHYEQQYCQFYSDSRVICIEPDLVIYQCDNSDCDEIEHHVSWCIMLTID